MDSNEGLRAFSGSKLFVQPEHYRSAREALTGYTLRKHHLVATEPYRPFCEEAIRATPRKLKMKIRSNEVIAYISQTQVFKTREGQLVAVPPATTATTTQIRNSRINRNPRRVTTEM